MVLLFLPLFKFLYILIISTIIKQILNNRKGIIRNEIIYHPSFSLWNVGCFDLKGQVLQCFSPTWPSYVIIRGAFRFKPRLSQEGALLPITCFNYAANFLKNWPNTFLPLQRWVRLTVSNWTLFVSQQLVWENWHSCWFIFGDNNHQEYYIKKVNQEEGEGFSSTSSC